MNGLPIVRQGAALAGEIVQELYEQFWAQTRFRYDGTDYELVGTDEAVDVSLELVADKARIATIAAFGRAGAAGIKALGGGPGADPGTDVRNAARIELARLAGQGRLRVVVAETSPLARAADAHRLIMAGHAAGKIALIP